MTYVTNSGLSLSLADRNVPRRDISEQRVYEAAQIAQAEERESIAKQRANDAEERQKESDERRRAQGKHNIISIYLPFYMI